MISVLMPCYNASRYLGPAIESILNQTFKNFEFIITDDGSTDGSFGIIESYAAQDKRIKVVKGAHKGIAVNLNDGIHRSIHPWIARMDADDIALPDRFELQLRASSQNPTVVGWGGYAYIINDKSETISVFNPGTLTEKQFKTIRRNAGIPFLVHPTVLLKKEIVLKAGGVDPTLETNEDLDLFDRMSEFGPLLNIPRYLLKYRVHNKSHNIQNEVYKRNILKYCRTRTLAARRGTKAVTYLEFKKDLEKRPAWLKMLEQIQNSGAVLLNKAAVCRREGRRLPGYFFVGLSFLVNPLGSFKRLAGFFHNQRLFRKLK